MEIKYNVKLLPERAADLNALLVKANEEFENSFLIDGKFLSTKEQTSNLDDSIVLQLKSFCKENKCHYVDTWFSDDISKSGIDFYDYEKNNSYSFESNLGANEVNILSFLILCGSLEYVNGIIFNGL